MMCKEIKYRGSTDKGDYEVVHRFYEHEGILKDGAYMRFSNSKHEVWGWEELRAMKEALDEFFAHEKPLNDESEEE